LGARGRTEPLFGLLDETIEEVHEKYLDKGTSGASATGAEGMGVSPGGSGVGHVKGD